MKDTDTSLDVFQKINSKNIMDSGRKLLIYHCHGQITRTTAHYEMNTEMAYSSSIVASKFTQIMPSVFRQLTWVLMLIFCVVHSEY